eukprot:g7222.t1
MTRRQPTSPTAVLIGAMSFLGRCRALPATTGAATTVSSVVRPTTAGAAAAQAAGRRAGVLGFLSPAAAATQRHSGARWARPSSLSLLGSWPSSSACSLSSFARPRASRGVAVASPSRRRKRTALGMVSDRPFRGPPAEVVEEVEDFSGLGLLDELVDAMDEFGFESPSKIQRKAIPQILGGGNVVFAASTGSGKTLAYLMPLIQQLRVQEVWRLLKHHEAGNLFMSKVNYVVVDEVDTMLTQGFAADIEKLTRPMLFNPERRETAQFVFVTATLTKAVRKLLEDGNYPRIRQVETRDVHHTLPSLRHVMIDIKGRDKMSALIDITQQHFKDFKRTLVFCNTVKSCRAAEFGLREVDLKALSYHGEVPSDERSSNLERFKAGDAKYLVCTDIAARGLDMPDVDHVIMFDFPLNPIDYLHRSGRTARMGAKGRVTSLLAKRDLVLAAAIEQAVQAGLPLDELSSRRTDYATGARLGPLFGRKGKVTVKGSHHSLKAVTNTRARGRVNERGERLGAPRKGEKRELAAAGGRGGRGGRRAAAGRGRGGAAGGGRSGGPGRARKYN